MKIDVIGTAREVEADRVEGGDVAVIDVFRATSVMVTALENGADEVIPVTGIEDAFRVREELLEREPGRRVVLGGERKTEQIEGFDLDNSPLRYTRREVEGASVVMSTTNGTRALNRATDGGRRQGQRGDIYVAAFLNADAVVRRLGAGGRDVVLVCAGRQDRFTIEDGLCAGMMASRLCETFEGQLSDFAWWCAQLYDRWRDDLRGALAHCAHYAKIRERWAADVDWCLRRDVSEIVPRLDRRDGAIRACLDIL